MMTFALGILIAPAALGLLDILYFIKTPPPPVDKSNVINRIRLYWFAKKHPDDLIEVYPWLLGDEGDNLK